MTTDEDFELGSAAGEQALSPAPTPWIRRTAIEMAVCGLLGLLTSLVLSVEAINLAANPGLKLICDLNAAISCQKVADSWQAQLFGFPNAFLGIAAEAIIITVAMGLLAGARYARWFMLWAEGIYTLGFVFALWLFAQSWGVIGALCPWCLMITFTTTLVWAGLTRINIREGHIRLPGAAGPAAVRFVSAGYDWFVTGGLLLVITAMVLGKYSWAIFGG